MTMRLELHKRWTEKLARLPESGMGYQRVRVQLKTGRAVEDALVFNAQVLEVPAGVPQFEASDIMEIELVAGRS